MAVETSETGQLFRTEARRRSWRLKPRTSSRPTARTFAPWTASAFQWRPGRYSVSWDRTGQANPQPSRF